MKSPQRRSSSPSPLAALRSEVERVRAALRELLGAQQQPLRPALIPIPVGDRPRPIREQAADPLRLHLAFGRKKDKSDADEDDDPGGLDTGGESDLDDLPPIPSALGNSETIDETAEVDAAPDSAGSWRPIDAASEGSTPTDDADEPAEDGELESELPAWGTASFTPPGPADSLEPDSDVADPPPWGVMGSDDEPAAFSPAVVGAAEEQPEHLSWLQSGTPEEAAPWALAGDAPSAEPVAEAEEASDPAAELDEIEPETPVEEEASGAAVGLDTFSETVTVEEEPWTSPVAVVEEAVVFQTSSLPVGQITSAEPSSLETRSFPLPEGEVVFRNLRAGFTDPSRLLRHLAGEGHTGVLHVLGVDGSNNYVVLVDGYVVAVAVDRQGNITTTNRISFPNFPNSQDTINVISYSRQIARGLGLLLHAPVRFKGLGAMFVNLEGLRSYLSKYSSSGGLIVHAQDGIGVALFEDGKLLGAYANGNSPTSDLGQLRDLVKDLEAEIDVRFGGPQELEPTPLDTLLSGHPL